MLRMFRQAVLGAPNGNTTGFKDLNGAEFVALYPFVILIFVFGLVYQPLLDLTGGPITHLVQNLTGN